MGFRETFVDGQEFFQQGAQFTGVQRVGSIGLCFFGIVVHFHEDTIDSGRDRRASQQRNKFGLSAAGRIAIFL